MMSRVEELPDDYVEAAPAASQSAPLPTPALPPDLASARSQSIDELAADLKRSPFFMTSLDDAGDEPNPELDAMRALLYEGTRAEIAGNFKETGNESVKAKLWKDAKESYTKGLEALGRDRWAGQNDDDEDDEEAADGKEGKAGLLKVGGEEGKTREERDKEEEQKEGKVKEQLLVNRALCHLELQNYRSCTHDCLAVLALSPSNVKAHYRLARALFALKKLTHALSASTAGLALDAKNAPLAALHAQVESAIAAAAVAAAAKQAELDRRQLEAKTLNAALASRMISCRWTRDRPDLPDGAEMKLIPDRASLSSTLVFPLVLLYPLHAQSDVIAAFGEEQTLAGHLAYLLPLPWDVAGEYTSKGTEAYLETKAGGLVKWGKEVELLRLISGGKVEVVDGIVRVNLVPRKRREEWLEAVRKRKSGGAA